MIYRVSSTAVDFAVPKSKTIWFTAGNGAVPELRGVLSQRPGGLNLPHTEIQ